MLGTYTTEDIDGDDQNEKDRWVIEKYMWHFQVIPNMHMVC